LKRRRLITVNHGLDVVSVHRVHDPTLTAGVRRDVR
jgi:hypothetical protein